jgi:hypothetical protein
MRTIRITGYILLACVLLTSLSFSQQRKAGLTGAAFLKIGAGARAVGLGSAVTAIPNDVNQMFWNPAGMALSDQRLQASFGYNRWLADIKHNSAAVAYNWEGIGTIGVGVITLGLSDIAADRDIPVDPDLKQFQIETNTSTTYDYRDIAVQLSFARYILDKLSLGATAKYISQSIDGQKATAIAFDFGSVYHIGVLDWTIAARFSNLGSDLKYYDIAAALPLSFSIGTAIAPWSDGQNKVMVSADAVKPQDGPQYVFAGGEVTFANLISVRGGYKFNYSGTDDGGTTSRPAYKNTIEDFSVGGGIGTTLDGNLVRVDYAFSKMKLLDNVHRVSVTVGIK